jgi:hypothetical protein
MMKLVQLAMEMGSSNAIVVEVEVSLIGLNNDRKYCNKEHVTYVRDMFRCTHCKREFGIASDNAKIGCCEVSRKQSFKKWSTGVKEAQKTVEINDRIEKLFKQNAEIKKAAQQQSH